MLAVQILNNSSDFNVAQIAGKPISNNPYSEIIASIISHASIYKNAQGEIVKSANKLATIIEKRDLVMQANKIFETRKQKIKEILKCSNLIPKATNETEELTNRILAEALTDHELIYGKGNITSERLIAMHHIAKHEASLEIAIRQEWTKHEAKAKKNQTANKALAKKQITSDIDTSVAIARHRMRQKMNEAEHHHIYEHNDQSRHERSDRSIAHNHMDSYQAHLAKISAAHRSHIHDNITQVYIAQARLKCTNRELELESQAQHVRNADMRI